MDNRGTLLQLDLTGILRQRMPRRINRLVPGFMLRALERLIRQDDLNALLRGAFPLEGSAFSDSLLTQLGVNVETVGLERTKPPHFRLKPSARRPRRNNDGENPR